MKGVTSMTVISDLQKPVLDLLDLEGQLSTEEVRFRDQARALVDSKIKPNIGAWFDSAYFPRELVADLARAQLLGTHLSGYGCPGRSAVEYGLGMMELEAGDSGIRTFASVQGSLAMSAIHKFGSEEQKNRYLPAMARGELIGCFGLTEPTAGSDPASMLTRATPGADGWVINGSKRWIGMASIADIAIVWARTPDGMRGFIVDTSSPGFVATPIGSKLSMRASQQCDVEFDDIHVPQDAMLPGTNGLRSALACLNEARYGIVWGAMGAARDSVEAALAYSLARTQFGQPIAGFQLTQEKLVNMTIDVQRGTLLALHLGRLKDAGTLTAAQVSFGKLSNVRDAIAVCRLARTVLGGNGVTTDYSPLRHANNLESVRTYEGTDEVHTLILGEQITGIGAFRQ